MLFLCNAANWELIARKKQDKMTLVKLIMAPLIGGIIGYITNSLAIRMLFRPHYEKRLFGRRIPFTPGLIPKEKSRIASAVGKTISENLMNREVLERSLLSDEMIGKIDNAIADFFHKQQVNEETLREFMVHMLSEEELTAMAGSVQSEVTDTLYHRLADSRLGDKIAPLAVDYVIGHIGIVVIPAIVTLLRESIQSRMAEAINDLLSGHARDIVGDIVSTETDNLLSKRVDMLLSGKDEQLGKMRNLLLTAYRKAIEEKLPKILEAVDISRIVEERINALPVEEAERIILDVMNKELKAIVWLGAVLGLLMGFVNVLW